jgi:hypothetical protein
MDVSAKRERVKPTGEGPHIQWDEEAIAEHDKLRGTRQKIEEPPTPYRYDDEEYDYEPDQPIHRDGHATMENLGGRSADIPIGSSSNRTSSSSSGASRELHSENMNFHQSHSPDSPSHPQTFAHSPSQTQVGDNVMDVWESLKAKLVYEQQKQSQGQLLRPVRLEEKEGSSLGDVGSGAVGDGSRGSGSSSDVKAGAGAGVRLPMGVVGSGHLTGDHGEGGGEGSGEGGRDGDDDDMVTTVGFDREPAPATQQFKSHRAAHYNEFQLMKAMREKMLREQEEEEED